VLKVTASKSKTKIDDLLGLSLPCKFSL